MKNILLAIALAAPLPAHAQSIFEHGDVLVSTVTETGMYTAISRILLYRADGTFKREIVSSDITDYRETLLREGVLYTAEQRQIGRFDQMGGILPPFRTQPMVYLSPAFDGSIVASDGLLYRFNPDGSIRTRRDTIVMFEPTARGVELTSDQCTVVFLSIARLGKWDSCRNTAPVLFGSSGPGPAGRGLRMLPDGGFIAAFLSDIVHYDPAGQIIRRFGIPGDAVALHVDGTSFWASAGGTLVKADIATGTILQLISVGANIDYLSVVGEPRAALRSTAEIPTASALALILLSAALILTAFFRLH